jgi:hypothetical protein
MGMKISEHLPHFKAPCLMIVAGKQEAVFFLAQDNKVEQINAVKLKKPHYTDREGRFQKSGNGKVLGSGSVYESQDDETTKQFIKQVAEASVNMVAQYDIKKIFLFCPTYLSNQMEDGLPKELQNLIDYIFYGNYNHQHPFVLLSKVQEYLREETDDRKVEPIKNEALDILKKTSQAMNEFKSRVY